MDSSRLGALVGRESPESRTSISEFSDLALYGHMLTMQQLRAFILMLHTGDIDLSRDTRLRAVDPRRLYSICCSIVLTTRESPISVYIGGLSSGHIPH